MIEEGDRQLWSERLLAENYRSVNYRYQESNAPEAITFIEISVEPSQIICCCETLISQCSETEDWVETDEYNLLETVRNRALKQQQLDQAAAEEELRQARQRWLMLGSEWIKENQPRGVEHAIIAEQHEDQSNPHAEYGGTRITRVIFLG